MSLCILGTILTWRSSRQHERPADSQYLAHLRRANSLQGEREYDKAIAEFTEAIRLDPRNSEAFSSRGYAWLDRGLRSGDRRLHSRSGAGTLEEGWLYNRRGEVWASQKEFDIAIADFSEAIRLNNPKSLMQAISFCNRGNAWHAKSEYDKAIADFSEAIRIDPTAYSAQVTRGLAFCAKGKYEEAVEDFNQVIRNNPQSAFAYYGRGTLHRANNKPDQAIADFSKAIQFDPKFAWYYHAATAWLAKEDNDKAITDCTEAIRLEPTCEPAYLTAAGRG